MPSLRWAGAGVLPGDNPAPSTHWSGLTGCCQRQRQTAPGWLLHGSGPLQWRMEPPRVEGRVEQTSSAGRRQSHSVKDQQVWKPTETGFLSSYDRGKKQMFCFHGRAHSHWHYYVSIITWGSDLILGNDLPTQNMQAVSLQIFCAVHRMKTLVTSYEKEFSGLPQLTQPPDHPPRCRMESFSLYSSSGNHRLPSHWAL